MFYIKIENDLIVTKFSSNLTEIPSGFQQITKEEYDLITLLPSSFSIGENGELVDITPIERPVEPTPEPQPTELELLQAQVELQQALLEDIVFNIIPNMVGDEL